MRGMTPQLLLLLSALITILKPAHAFVPNIAKPGCNPTCGDVGIPYPFGIGAGCFLEPWFEVECKASPNTNASSKPFLSKLNVELVDILLGRIYSHYGQDVLIVLVPPLSMCNASAQLSSIDLRGSPYSFSNRWNVLAMDGCPGTAILLDQNKRALAGCGTACNDNRTGVPGPNSSGLNSCEANLDYRGDGPFQSYLVDMESQLQSSDEHQNCLVANLRISEDFPAQVFRSYNLSSGAPVLMVWRWPPEHKIPNFNQSTDAYCFHEETENPVCNCKSNHYGNPFIPNGCQVPEECKGCLDDNCQASYPNNYTCYRQPSRHSKKLLLIIGVNLGFGFIFLVIGGCSWIYRLVKRIREMNRRANLFKRNGGLLLHQHLSSSNERFVERIKIFNTDELDKASDNFNENRILGQGGQGTVYKGILTDGRTVAIKKTRVLNESQLEQFVNEVVILSQINHRNVVKLLGCCLETELPLLVYEYISNGALHQHIHEPDEDFVIGWEMRLKIATDSAGAIAYLHSSSSVPIYHRDIKSSNILLDGNHRAKVADFGCSKTIEIDQTHFTTLVRGTFGYLDPEYFQTNQFSEKSDVYSFGVVLLELLTSKKPIFKDQSTMEPKNLVAEFLLSMKKSRLSSILDPEIVKEAKEEELMVVVQLAKRCLNWTGKLRPTMKEVAMTLETIIKAPGRVSIWDQQALPHESFSENVISEISDAKIPVHVSAVSPSYTDDQRLLPNTV